MGHGAAVLIALVIASEELSDVRAPEIFSVLFETSFSDGTDAGVFQIEVGFDFPPQRHDVAVFSIFRW